MRIVVGGPEKLTAGRLLVYRRDAAADRHALGCDRLAHSEAAQGGAERAQQERGFDQIALRLLDRERGEIAIVERSLAHHAIDAEAELLANLRRRELGDRRIASPLLGEQPVRCANGGLAALDDHRHAVTVCWWCAATRRGRAHRRARDRRRRESRRGCDPTRTRTR